LHRGRGPLLQRVSITPLNHGIRDNFGQFAHQVVQVFFVGLAVGMMRTVVPPLSESEFGVARGDQRGPAIGMNEFSGHVGVAVAGIVTAYLTGALESTFWLVAGAMVLSGLVVQVFSKETRPGSIRPWIEDILSRARKPMKPRARLLAEKTWRFAVLSA
jgi:MFS family permease